MAILIVDPVRHSREVMRAFLRQMGMDVIREAGNATEAARILDVEKARIRAVLATDGTREDEGRELARTIADRYELNGTLFILVSSRRRWFRRKQSRIDARIVKPFRVGALAGTFSRAYQHRLEQRRTVLYVTDAATDDPAMIEGLGGPWDNLVRVRTHQEFNRYLESHQGTVGAALIDPVCFKKGKDWLGPFTKTPLARMITLVCLGRSAEAASPLRTYCHLFVEPGTNRAQWREIFELITQRACAAGDVEWLATLFKTFVRNHDVEAARKVGAEMLKRDPRHPEANCFMGELLESLSEVAEAASYYRSAVEANPCFPLPYIKLLELLPRETDERVRVADQAAIYCPGHGGTLRKVAQVWREVGQAEKADALMSRFEAKGAKK